MPFSEFAKIFTNLEMCHLPPEAWNFEPRLKHRIPWKSVEAHRQWRRGYNAGGGLNSRKKLIQVHSGPVICVLMVKRCGDRFDAKHLPYPSY